MLDIASKLMHGLLSAISIKARILLLIAISALGFVLVGAIYMIGNARTQTTFLDQSRFADLARTVLAANEKMVRLHQLQDEFLHARTRPVAEKFRQQAVGLRADLERAAASADLLDKAQPIKKVAGDTEAYLAGFEQLVTLQARIGFDEKFVAIGVDGKIAAADPDLSIAVDNSSLRLLKRLNDELDFGESVDLLRLVTTYYRLRELQSRYFVSSKPDDRQLFDAEYKKLLDRLAVAPMDDTVRDDMKEAANAYATSFNRWVEARSEIDAKTGELVALIARLERTFATLVEAAQLSQGQALAVHEATQTTLDLAFGAVIGIGLVLVIVFGLLVAFSIIWPLQKIIDAMRHLAGGDTSVDLQCVHKHELGAMFGAVRVFRANALERARLEQVAHKERDKERERQAHMERRVQGFRQEIQAVVGSLGEQMDTMRASAGTLNQVAELAASDAEEAGRASHSASATVESISVAAGKLAAAIREIAAQSERSRIVVQRAREVTSETEREFAGLEEKAKHIGNVVDIIRAIADQTNLLALNATIEAARAGEAGRGFAVVAGEVKQLSAQTAKATDEIAGQIAGVQSTTDVAVGFLRDVSQAILEVSDLANMIAQAAVQQDHSTQEITLGISSASQGSHQASQSVSRVSESIADTEQEANRVRDVTHHLTRVAEQLAGAVEHFLDNVAQDVEARRADLVGLEAREAAATAHQVSQAA